MKLQHEIGLLIRKARIQKQMTQLELAEKLGYNSAQFVSLMERGLSKAPRPVLKKLIKILNLNRYELVEMIINDFKRTLESEI